MANFKKLINKSKTVEENASEKSAKVLMDNGFLIILLNMVFGLLPITIVGNRLHHSFCSISSAYSVALLSAMSFLTIFFVPVSFDSFNYDMPKSRKSNLEENKAGIADTIAVFILTGAHVVGFMVLVTTGAKVAHSLPKIWDSVAQAFQIAVIDIYGTHWKPIQKLRRFCIRSIFICTAIAFMMLLSVAALSMKSVILSFSMKVFPVTDDLYAIAIFTGYIIWCLVSLSHILVCLLINFFLIVIILCLKSANNGLRDLLKIHLEELDNQNLNGGRPAHREVAMELHLTREFRKITRIYSICDTVTKNLSSTFGISLIVEVLVLLGNMLVNLFFLIVYLLDEESQFTPYEYFDLISASFYNFYFLFQVSSSVTKMINESRKPLHIIDGIQYDFNSPRIKEKIQSFKMDIANNRITLSANDYFQVDRRMISALIGAVTTYLIVMLQFKQQESPPKIVKNPINESAIF